MAGFSASEAAFEGFRLARQHPAAIVAWAVVLFVFNLIATSLLIGMAGPALAEMIARGPQAEPDPAEMMTTLGAIGPAYALILLLSLAMYAVLYGAVHRAVLRPAEGGPGFLRAGQDELRMGLGLLLVLLILLGAYIGLLLLTGVVVGLASVAGAGRVVAPLALLVVTGVLIWLGVRLSLVLPATFDHRRLAIKDAWRLTKGRFWPLLGAYLLAFLLGLLVFLLALVIFTALAALLGGGLDFAGQLLNPDLSSLSAYFRPLTLLNVAFSAVVTALATAITVGVSADAYRQITRAGVPAAEIVA